VRSSTASAGASPSAVSSRTPAPSSSSSSSTTRIEAWAKGYRDLRASTDYNVDYNLLATTRLEPLLRDIRNGMEGAGLYCEGVKGECNFGQQEIAFRYAEVQETADQHTLYKNGAKEIADAHGKALTFMAKFNEREGNSCHIHLSVRSETGEPVMAGDGAHGFSPLMGHWIAGILATMREFTSSTPRPSTPTSGTRRARSRRPGSRGASTTARVRCASWGTVRGCASRTASRRRREPVPRISAIIAGGLYGIENELPLPDALAGNAYEAGVDTLPTTLREAAELFAGSSIARAAFGDEMVEHYLNQARIEVEAYDAAVTDWERVRGFERL
jgi:glutamine synthetase